MKNSRIKCWTSLIVFLPILLISINTWNTTDVLDIWEVMKSKRITTNKTEEGGLNTGLKSNFSNNVTRLNVIILTHMSSGSTFFGNLFNLHPDVFYLYEPLNKLRMTVYGDRCGLGEWNVLDKKAEKSYRLDFFNLLGDLFTCNFQREKTIDYLFPDWLRRSKDYLAWQVGPKGNFTRESVREACKSRRIIIAKIMQTRLPGEIGVRELQQICSSQPDTFKCLIVHLVRDPRAVTSSLIINKFYMPNGPKKKLIVTRNACQEGKEMIRRHSNIMCSQIEENLKYVNEEWSNWFRGRYILIRYEDTVKDLIRTMQKMYNFTGLPMVNSITKWVEKGIRPTGITNRIAPFVISKSDTKRIEHWRPRLEASQVSEFEKGCWPLMYMMGYIGINGSVRVLRDGNLKLYTDEMPFPFNH